MDIKKTLQEAAIEKVASDRSMILEPMGLLPRPYADHRVEAAYQLQHNEIRKACTIFACVSFAAADIMNAIFTQFDTFPNNEIQWGQQWGPFSGYAIALFASGLSFLILLAVTLYNKASWELEDRKTRWRRWWLTIMILCCVRISWPIAKFHILDYDTIALKPATTAVCTAAMALMGSTQVFAIGSAPTTVFVFPVMYAALLLSINLVNPKVLGPILVAVMVFIFGMARHIMVDQRSTFADQVKLRRSQNELMQSALDQADQVSQAKDAASAKIMAASAHDMRTPVTALSSGCKILRKLDRPTQEQMNEIVDLMDAAVNLSFRCLDSFTITAKLLNGVEMEPINTQVFNLKHLMDMCIQTCMLSGGTSPSVQYNSDIAPGLSHSIRTSREHVMRNLMNLLSNAGQFTETGSINVCVTLCTSAHNEDNQCQNTLLSAGKSQLKITVVDTGRGVPLEDQERIWMPFVSLSKQGKQQQHHLNSGLGLFVVKKQCEAIGGHCGMEQTVNPGSTFWFTVPYDPVTEPLETTISIEPAGCHFSAAADVAVGDGGLFGGGRECYIPPAEGVLFGGGRGGGKGAVVVGEGGLFGVVGRVSGRVGEGDQTERIEMHQSLIEATSEPAHILMIDDTQSVLKLAAMMLKHEGYKVTTAGGANEGLHAMEAQQFDLVLCDYCMPAMLGSQLTRQFRDWEEGNGKDELKQVIWALSAHTSESMEKECVDAGMQGVLTKPLEITDVQTIIRQQRETRFQQC